MHFIKFYGILLRLWEHFNHYPLNESLHQERIWNRIDIIEPDITWMSRFPASIRNCITKTDRCALHQIAHSAKNELPFTFLILCAKLATMVQHLSRLRKKYISHPAGCLDNDSTRSSEVHDGFRECYLIPEGNATTSDKIRSWNGAGRRYSSTHPRERH